MPVHYSRLLTLLILLLLLSPTAVQSQDVNPDEIPPPVDLVSEGEWDIVNILLMGSDTTNPRNSGRTDALMLISVNPTAGSVSMLSIPRDLYVYIPGYRVYRINTALGYGEQTLREGRGIELLLETIRYNLGVEVDFWARVDFNGFRQIVDDLGGIEIAVDCAIQDWRLIDPSLDPQMEESWEMFTLPVGMHTMNGDLALWYARSRRTSSDLDRGRRQQALVRAIWRRIAALNLFEQVRDFYPQLLDIVDTNMSVEDALRFMPLVSGIDPSRMSSYTMQSGREFRSWRSPEGSSVLAPLREGIAALIADIYRPPTESQIVRESSSIEVVNATGLRGMDRVAADRLSWEGFNPSVGPAAPRYQNYTVIYDYTGQAKGSSLARLQSILRVGDDSVIVQPDPQREFDFRVILGGSYYSCTHAVAPPQPPTEEAADDEAS
ncbi:LCP family protein [Kamptonema cortianum]|nr:LCP family protein [Kamptonema cortianum]